jgi:putative intracellular protease/amidase
MSASEYAQTIQAMKPLKRKRPVVVVLAGSAGAETTDFLIPYGVLTQSDVADVLAVAPIDATLQLRPALKIRPQATLAAFDARFPEGADYVIVPAMRSDPAVIAWLKAQAAKGATIMGVCAGTLVLSEAGLLKDRRATGYWLNADELRNANPSMRWVANRRFVADRGVITTTGITASMPASLALVEAIGGRSKAEAVAATLGLKRWNGDHDSGAFGATQKSLMDAADAKRGIPPTALGVPVADGVDEIALAFIADAFSRPYGTLAVTVSPSPDPVRTKRGLLLLPDRQTDTAKAPKQMIPELAMTKPAQVLDASLEKIAERSGKDVADLVALQMEYPRGSFAH